MLELSEACSKILVTINYILQQNQTPILVVLDGGSGAGKSTLACMLEQKLDSVVVPSDDFFAANISDWEWDVLSIPNRAREVLDWQRLRTDALEPLLASKTARWHPFDFAAGLRSDGTYAMSKHFIEKQAAPVIILEGAYSSSPEIADLINLTVLIDVPILERHQRLDKREGDKQFLQRWHTIWDAVEGYYFSEVMPKSAFDLVVSGSSTSKPLNPKVRG
jgi:uridine kinase